MKYVMCFVYTVLALPIGAASGVVFNAVAVVLHP